MKAAKKHQAAIAAIGATLAMASASALAQSNVTVFGQVSVGVTKATGGATQLATTGWGSGIGFKGTEDLGGGLSAFFHIENRFNLDTGVASTPFWAEKIAVGLAGGFGKVQLGRFANAFDDIIGMADPFGETVANMSHENALGETKWANSIGYHTLVMSGFSGAVTIATKEAVTPGTGSPLVTQSPYALNVKYVEGPLAVALGHVRNGVNDVASTSLAGNYDFGAAKVYGGYTSSANTGTGNARNMQVGAGVPMGAAAVKAAYSSYKADTNLSDRKNKLGLGYWYNISKRTMFYADVARTSTKIAGTTTNVNAFDLGIFHKF